MSWQNFLRGTEKDSRQMKSLSLQGIDIQVNNMGKEREECNGWQ